jgi:hypothetical protein
MGRVCRDVTGVLYRNVSGCTKGNNRHFCYISLLQVRGLEPGLRGQKKIRQTHSIECRLEDNIKVHIKRKFGLNIFGVWEGLAIGSC